MPLSSTSCLSRRAWPQALLCFYVLGSARLEAAPDWLSASYAQVLYLKAHLDHAVKLLTALGSEPSCACLSRWMAAQPHEAVVAIESAGLPQSVQFPVSAVNGPQDAYSEALRLVFMVDQVTGAPLALSFVLNAAVCTLIELVMGLMLNQPLPDGSLPLWDYRNMFCNFMGQICLPFTVLWFFISAPAIVLDDYLRYWFFGEEKPHYTIKIGGKPNADHRSRIS